MPSYGDPLDAMRAMERKLDRILDRLEAIEGRLGAQPTTSAPAPEVLSTQSAPSTPIEPVAIVPPPVLQPSPAPAAEVAPAPALRAEWDSAPVTAAPAQPVPPQPVVTESAAPPASRSPRFDWEYVLGSRVLPWAGALLLIAALGYFVAIGIERGVFTPVMQFASALLASSVFIVIGIRKRDEREDFGNLLSGIGSCGVFLTLVGGHLYQRLYEGELLIGLCMAWSAANLLYANVVRSQSFLLIGAIGGMGAAYLPLGQQRYSIHAELMLLVSILASAIVVRQRWLTLSVLLAGLAIVLPMPLLFSPAPWTLQIGVVYGLALIYACANVLVWEPNEIDPHRLVAGGLAAIAALAAFGIRHEMDAVWMHAAGGAAFTLVGLAMRKNPAGAILGATGGVILVCLVPCSFTPAIAALWFGSASVAAYFVWQRWNSPVIAGVGWATLAQGAFAYLLLLAKPGTWAGYEGAILAVLAAGAVAISFVPVDGSPNMRRSRLIAFVLLAPIVTRAAYVAAEGVGWDGQPTTGVAIAWVAYGVLTSVVAGRTDSLAATMGWCSIWAGYLLYFFIGIHEASAASQCLVAALGLAGLVVALRATHHQFRFPELFELGAASLAATGIHLLVARASVLAFRLPESTTNLVGAMAAGAVILAAAARWNRIAVGALGWFAVFAAWVCSFVPIAHGEANAMVLHGSFLAYLLLATCLARRVSGLAEISLWIAMPLGWVQASQAASQMADAANPLSAWATTASWVAYASALLVLGILAKLRTLRVAAMAIFAVSILKVLNELQANIDPFLRVAVLFFFGMAMLLAGYWYIRTRPFADPPSSPKPN